MRDQKIEFLQMQLTETKEIFEETQRQHKNLLNLLNSQQHVRPSEEDKERI